MKTTNPFDFFDAIYCINVESDAGRWKVMRRRFHALGILDRVKRFDAIETPDNHHIGCALSHRGIIETAQRLRLGNVLVFEDDTIFFDRTNLDLRKSIAELQRQNWQIFYLGGCRWSKPLNRPRECHNLEISAGVTCTHALAYHNQVYSQLLRDIPADAEGVKEWLAEEYGIDQYLRRVDRLFIANPILASQPAILPMERAFQRHRFVLGDDTQGDTRLALATRISIGIYASQGNRNARQLIEAIRERYPDVLIRIVDDCPGSDRLNIDENIDHFAVARDTGLHAAQRILIEECLTPYMLFVTDNAEFSPEIKLARLLNAFDDHDRNISSIDLTNGKIQIGDKPSSLICRVEPLKRALREATDEQFPVQLRV